MPINSDAAMKAAIRASKTVVAKEPEPVASNSSDEALKNAIRASKSGGRDETLAASLGSDKKKEPGVLPSPSGGVVGSGVSQSSLPSELPQQGGEGGVEGTGVVQTGKPAEVPYTSSVMVDEDNLVLTPLISAGFSALKGKAVSKQGIVNAERHTAIATASAEKIRQDYEYEKKRAFDSMDFAAPKRLDQQRLGKAAKYITDFQNGDSKIEDFKYLLNAAPEAARQLVSQINPNVKLTNDNEIANFLAASNKQLKEFAIQNKIKYYQDQSVKVDKDIENIGGTISGFDKSKVLERDYATELKNQKFKELTELRNLYPSTEIVAEFGSTTFRANEAEYNQKVAELNSRYAENHYLLGISAANAYAKKNPAASPLEVGLVFLKNADPETYQLRQRSEKNKTPIDGRAVKVGISVLYGTGNKDILSKLEQEEKDYNKNHPEEIIRETIERIGAEHNKAQSAAKYLISASPSTKDADEYVKSMPQENREAYYAHIRNSGKLNDVPLQGAVNQFGLGAAGVVKGTANFGLDLLSGVTGGRIGRTEADRAYDELGAPYETRYAKLGEYQVANQQLADLRSKQKTTKLSIEELTKLRDLESYTDNRTGLGKFVDASMNVAGQVLAQAALTKGLGGAATSTIGRLGLLAEEAAITGRGIGSIAQDAVNFGIRREAIMKAASAAVGYAASYDDASKQALRLMPGEGDGVKRQIFSTFVAGINAASENIFKDYKAFDAFKKEVAPSVSNLVTRLTSGEITQQALGGEIKDIVKSGLKGTGKWVGNTFVENTKEATEELATSLGTSVATLLLAPTKFNANDAFDDAVNTFTTMFTDGAIVAGMAGAKSVRANRVSMPLIARLGVDNNFTNSVRMEVDRQLLNGDITQDEANEKMRIINTAEKINKTSIPAISEYKDLSPEQKIKYFGQLLNESVLKGKLKAAEVADSKSKTEAEVLRDRKAGTVEGINELAKTGVITEEEAEKRIKDVESETSLPVGIDNLPVKEISDKIKESEEIRRNIINNKLYVTDDFGLKTQEEINSEPEIVAEATIQPSSPDSLQPSVQQPEITPVGQESKVVEPDTNMQEVIGGNGIVLYNGQRARIIQDGQTIVASIIGTNKEYEIGNVNEVSGKAIKEFGIDTEKSVVSSSDQGDVVVRGVAYKNLYSNPLSAINRDEDGNVVSVNLNTENGEARTFRGNIAEDIAYELTLKSIDNGKFEDFLNSDQEAVEAMEGVGLSETSETEAEIPSRQIPETEQQQQINPTQNEPTQPTQPVQQPAGSAVLETGAAAKAAAATPGVTTEVPRADQGAEEAAAGAPVVEASTKKPIVTDKEAKQSFTKEEKELYRKHIRDGNGDAAQALVESKKTPPIETQEPAAANEPEVSQPAAAEPEKTFEQRTDTEHADFIRDKFVKVFTAKGVPEEQVRAAVALMDARANAAFPDNPDVWYRQIQDIGNGDFVSNVPSIKAKGAVERLANGMLVIHALGAPDFSTAVHEMAHVFEESLSKEEKVVIVKWAKTDKWNSDTSEAFARGFERYLLEGKAPTAYIKGIFERAKKWMASIYKNVTGSPIEKEITPEVKQVFDNLFKTEKQKQDERRKRQPAKPAATGSGAAEKALPVVPEKEAARQLETSETIQQPEKQKITAREATIVQPEQTASAVQSVSEVGKTRQAKPEQPAVNEPAAKRIIVPIKSFNDLKEGDKVVYEREIFINKQPANIQYVYVVDRKNKNGSIDLWRKDADGTLNQIKDVRVTDKEFIGKYDVQPDVKFQNAQSKLTFDERREKLKELLDDGIITQEEYEEDLAQIDASEQKEKDEVEKNKQQQQEATRDTVDIKELDDLSSSVPNGDKVGKYLSGQTITQAFGDKPGNDQSYIAMELEKSLLHGTSMVAKARELWGANYEMAFLDYIDKSSASVSAKALMYVSLENDLAQRKIEFPSQAAAITTIQNAVYEVTQDFARETSKAMNYWKLRNIAMRGYDTSETTALMFTDADNEERALLEIGIVESGKGKSINEEADRVEAEKADVEKEVAEAKKEEKEKSEQKKPERKKSKKQEWKEENAALLKSKLKDLRDGLKNMEC